MSLGVQDIEAALILIKSIGPGNNCRGRPKQATRLLLWKPDAKTQKD